MDLDFKLESRIAKKCLIITILLSCCSVVCWETPVVQRTCPSRCRNRCLLITTSAVGDGNCLQGVCRRIDRLLPLIQVTPCCVRDPCDQQVSEAASNCCHAPSTGRYIIHILALNWFVVKLKTRACVTFGEALACSNCLRQFYSICTLPPNPLICSGFTWFTAHRLWRMG